MIVTAKMETHNKRKDSFKIKISAERIVNLAGGIFLIKTENYVSHYQLKIHKELL
jgi:hypothetical protein